MRRWIVMLGGISALAVVAVIAVVNASGISDGLEDDARAALADAGIEVDDVSADGRDLTLVPNANTDIEQALAVLDDLDGVRDVDLPESSAGPTTTVGATTSSPTSSTLATTAPTTTAPSSTTGSTTTTSPTTTVPTTTVPSTTVPTTTVPTTTTTVPVDPSEAIDDLLTADPIEFDPALDEPTEASKLVLDEVAAALDGNDARIELVGYFDEGDDEDENLLVALDRAWSVAGYLEWRGIDFDRMDVSSNGSTGIGTSGPRVDLTVLEGGSS